MSGSPVRRAGVLAITALLTAGALQVPSAPAAEAAVGWVGINDVTSTMFPHTQFAMSGTLANKTPRKVTLQVKSGSSTRNIAYTQSKPGGTYTFTGVKLSATSQVRAVTARQTVTVASGPKAQARHRKRVKQLAAAKKRFKRVKRKLAQGKVHRGIFRQARHHVRVARRLEAKARKGLTRRVTVKRSESRWTTVKVVTGQSARIAALPAIVQPGPTTATPREDNVISAGFVPARAGRPVTLEKQTSDGEWVVVDSGTQDRSGHGVFSVHEDGTYRMSTEATAEAPAFTTQPVTTRDWKLDFEDQFNGTSLNTSKWGPQIRSRGTGFRTCARTDGASSSVKDGVLRMGVSKDPTMGSKTCAYTDEDGKKHQLPYMRNTQLATEGKYDFRYGIAAARVKTQSAVGMHSAFWMLPNQKAVPGRPDLGNEVDIFEYFGDRPQDRGVAAFVHTLSAKGVTTKHGDEFVSTVLMKSPQRFSEEYHVFSLEWTPTQYVFRLDGREFFRSARDISQVNQHLVLSNLTSSYELVDLKDRNDVAKVDWVRVWK